MKPTSTELDVECPKCGAIPGERCREKRIKRSHMGRRLQEIMDVMSSRLPPRDERRLWI
jgi:hypothetical protein